MPSEDTEILEFNQYRKFDKKLSVIYADFESLIERIEECKSNFEKSFTKELGQIFPVSIQCLRYGHLMV